jgi:hypothetical protein
MNGAYRVGPSYPVKNPFDMIDSLVRRGISEDVIIGIESGMYTGNFVIPHINGVSDSCTIIFKSITNDSTDVVIQSNSGKTLTLDGADYITIRSVTLKQNASDNTVYFQNGCSNIAFRRCIIEGYNSSSTSSSVATILNTSSDNSSIAFFMNEIKEGSYGVYFNSTATDIRFVSNNISGYYNQGVYLGYLNNIRFDNNFINDLGSSYSYVNNLKASNCSNLKIVNNVFESENMCVEIQYSGYNPSTNDTTHFYNNVVYSDGYSSALKFSSNESFLNVHHNTIYNRDGIALDISNCETGFCSNNILYSENCTKIISLYRADLMTVDNNVYYTPCSHDNVFSYNYMALPGLEEWQYISGKDAGSVFINPDFELVPGNFRPKNGAVANLGIPVENVAMDIEGVARDTIYPDPGAYEFDPKYANDVYLQSIITPVVPNCARNNEISVRIKNTGLDKVLNMKIEYSVNNAVIGTVNWNYVLAPFESAKVSLGSYRFDGDNDSLFVEVVSVNNRSDDYPANNSLEKLNIYAPLSGTYTFGGANPSFDTLPDLVNRIVYGGVCGPVTVLFRNGTYTDNGGFNLKKIPGSTAWNFITFKSESGNPADVIIQPEYTWDYSYISVNNTSNIAFENMTFNLNPSDCNSLIRMEGKINNFRFTGNMVYADSSSCSETVIQRWGIISDVEITGNTIFSGTGTMDFGCETGSKNLIIRNNHLEGNFNDDILDLEDIRNVEVSGNTFIGTSPDANGIYVNNVEGLRFYNNIVRLDSSSSIGLDMEYSYGTPFLPNLIYNNFIYVGGNSGNYPITGVYFYYNGFTTFANNTVHSRNPNNTANGDNSVIYIGHNGADEVVNNIFYNSLGGNLVWIEKDGMPRVMDYNNFYGGNIQVYTYPNNELYSTLDEWQATGYDPHSYNVDPLFSSTTDFHPCAAMLNNTGMVLNFIKNDLDSESRSLKTPDIGADEFSIYISGKGFIEDDKVLLCNGAAVLSTKLHADTYSWSTGETTPTISTTSPGTYIVNFTSACGMDGIDTITVLEFENTFNAIQTGALVKFAYNIPEDEANYLWDFGDGSTSSEPNPVHFYVANGNYTVTLTVESECGTDTLVKNILILSTDIAGKTNSDDTNPRVYPNPAINSLHVSWSLLSEIKEKVNVSIIDMMGETIREMEISGANLAEGVKIPFDGLVTGVYFIKIKTATIAKSVKFVKK